MILTILFLILTIALLLVGIVAYLYFRSGNSKSESVSFAKLHGTGRYEFNIVGESHYQTALEKICGGRTDESANEYVEAYLYLENDNEHDNLAVRVDIKGNIVGYLSKQDARSYRQQLYNLGHSDLVGICDAIIVGGWFRSSSDVGHFGVKLDLPVN